jgi:hypothetical protein
MTAIQWLDSYEDGLKQAGDSNKPLLLDFFKDG